MTTARDRPPEEAAEDTSFARGLRLLLMVADRGEIRVDELSTLLDMPLSTAYRYLRTLGEFGFVDKHDGRYRLGPRLLISPGSTVTSERLIRLADPVLQELVDVTGETALVMRRVGLTAVCLHQVEAKNALRVAVEPGSMHPLYAGAASRVLLAFAPPEVVDEVTGQGLRPLTPNTPGEATLRQDLQDIVATGIAVSEGELLTGTVTVAVPIFREDGIVGALAVIGPDARCGLGWRTRVRKLLPVAASSIMSALSEDRQA